MGYNANLIRHTLDMYKAGWFDGLQTVLELGAQVFDFHSSYDEFVAEIETYCGRPLVRDDAVRAFRSEQSLSPELLYRLIGFEEYHCADYDIGFIAQRRFMNALLWDLNREIPEQYHGRFDLLTNHGTCEHVFNLLQAFKNIHLLTHESSLIVHTMPFQGYFDLTFFTFQETFYRDLACANDYEILSLHVLSADLSILPFEEWLSRPKSRRQEIHAQITTAMQRKSDKPFQIPYQGMYKSGGNSLELFKDQVATYAAAVREHSGGRSAWVCDGGYPRGYRLDRMIRLAKAFGIDVTGVVSDDPGRWGGDLGGVPVGRHDDLPGDVLVLVHPRITRDALLSSLGREAMEDLPECVSLHPKFVELAEFVGNPELQG